MKNSTIYIVSAIITAYVWPKHSDDNLLRTFLPNTFARFKESITKFRSNTKLDFFLIDKYSMFYSGTIYIPLSGNLISTKNFAKCVIL